MFHALDPPYGTIVADPPWRYNAARTVLRSGGRGAGAEHHYPTMDNAELAALPVAGLAADQAHLYLWVTTPRLIADRYGRRVVTPQDICEAWGFTPITLLTWIKPGRNGTGWYFRGQTEHVLFGVRGRLGIPPSRREPNVIFAPRRRHSQKPDELYAVAERVSPRPRVDLFARDTRLGWDTWGNEINAVRTDPAMADLEIPDRAWDAALAVNVAGLKSGSAQLLRLKAACPIVMAAELRRLADMVPDGGSRTLLLGRADELDPQGGAR